MWTIVKLCSLSSSCCYLVFFFCFVKRPITAQEVVDFLLMRSKFYPDMFRHIVAILRGSWVPSKLPKRCSVFWRVRIMTRSVWPVVVECVQVYIQVCVYIHVHICIYTCIYKYMCIYICVCVYMYIYLDTFHNNWPHRTGHNPHTPKHRIPIG
jgi:hypothetical protein